MYCLALHERSGIRGPGTFCILHEDQTVLVLGSGLLGLGHCDTLCFDNVFVHLRSPLDGRVCIAAFTDSIVFELV